MFQRVPLALTGVIFSLLLAGCSGQTDLAKVAADRASYSGKTVQSKAVLVGISGTTGPMYLLPLGVAPGAEQKITIPSSLQKKASDVELAVGRKGVVLVKYTVAKTGTYPEPLGELVDISVP
jgi:hypothetical protein